MQFKILRAAAVILIAAALAYFYFDKIVLFSLSKIYSLDISYKILNKDAKNVYTFENLKVLNKKMGAGFFSARAALKPLWGKSFLKSVNMDFKFKDVHFIKGKAEELKTQYDTLEKIVAMPFEGRWTYKDISGSVEIFSNGLTLKKFSASGSQIRLALTGDVYYNNMIDADITLYFSKNTLTDIPPELTGLVMQDEPEEWKSFSVKLKGDCRSPSVQITGKQFRLNIGTMVMKD